MQPSRPQPSDDLMYCLHLLPLALLKWGTSVLVQTPRPKAYEERSGGLGLEFPDEEASVRRLQHDQCDATHSGRAALLVGGGWELVSELRHHLRSQLVHALGRIVAQSELIPLHRAQR